MNKNRLTRDEAVAIINSGKIVTVEFTKRTDDSHRVMNCRTGVKKYLAGTRGKGAAYNFSDNQLIPVYDLKEGGYKAIPKERILNIRIGGKTYQVI